MAVSTWSGVALHRGWLAAGALQIPLHQRREIKDTHIGLRRVSGKGRYRKLTRRISLLYLRPVDLARFSFKPNRAGTSRAWIFSHPPPPPGSLDM